MIIGRVHLGNLQGVGGGRRRRRREGRRRGRWRSRSRRRREGELPSELQNWMKFSRIMLRSSLSNLELSNSGDSDLQDRQLPSVTLHPSRRYSQLLPPLTQVRSVTPTPPTGTLSPSHPSHRYAQLLPTPPTPTGAG